MRSLLKNLVRMLAPLLLLAIALTLGAETLNEKIAATDMSDADQVFDLADWCTKNKLPTQARKYYNTVIQINKDHEGARTALGQVQVNGHWVSAGIAGGKGKPGDAAPADQANTRQASGPGPTAAQINWDLTLPKDPQPDSLFINTYIDRMATVANDSSAMDVSIATMLMDEHLALSVPRLCKALTRPDFKDIYGACQFALELMNKKGRTAEAKKLLPFIMKASERVTDADDLQAFAYSVGAFRDKRVVPRLIELLDHPNAEVKSMAAEGIAQVSLLPAKSITVDSAKHWWDLNHNVSDEQVFTEQLRSADAKVQVGAAVALYDFRNKAIVPVLIKLLKSDDRDVCTQAITVIQKITGQSWSYDPVSGPAIKAQRADAIDKWWKEEQFRFVWIEDRAKAPVAGAPVEKKDPAQEWVSQLGSAEGNVAQQAEANLTAKGDPAVAFLIEGLANPNVLVRRKSNDILRSITKQDIPFDARDDEDKRKASIEAWRKWAISKKLITPAADAGGDDAAPEAPAKPDQPKPKPPAKVPAGKK